LLHVIKRIENWPEAVSLKLGFGRRSLSLLSLRNGVNVVVRRNGADWDVVREIFLRDGYQRSMAHLKALTGEHAVLDLGGNIGCFSLLAASQNAGLHLHSYEPGPPNVRIFQMNMLANPILSARIQLHTEAVGGANMQAD